MILDGIKESSGTVIRKTDIVLYNDIPCLVIELSKMQGYGLVALEGFDEGRIIKEYKSHIDVQLAKLKLLVEGKDVCITKASSVKIPF